MTMADPKPTVENPEAMKAEWLDRLEGLVQDVQSWAQAEGWRTRRITKTVRERRLGKYEVPVLLMEKETVEVVLNPVARFVPEADGAVDLYLSPAYDDIASLYFESGQWVVHDGDRPDPSETNRVVEIKRRPCNEATIRGILGRMAAHA